MGFAVASREWVGVFNTATVPQWRRRGAVTPVLRVVAGWGLEQGARDGYLQVHPANAGAQALYALLGFTTQPDVRLLGIAVLTAPCGRGRRSA